MCIPPKIRMDFPIISCCKLWILFLHLTQLSVSFSLQTGNETDMQSLLAFKAQITHDPLGVLASWNHSLHFCQWRGVTCGRRHRRVVELDLSSSKLQGSLSPHVGNLNFLRGLYLDNNSFTHHIPQELGRLFRLQALDLGNNTFGGVIPVNISRCSNLLSLNLQLNNFTGKLPVELGTLSKLEELAFSSAFSPNNLVGEIPPSLGNLSSIITLRAADNNLQGGIPTSMGQLKRLRVFTLNSNNLTGVIPSSVYNLSSLAAYDVAVNNFHGRLPSDLFQTLSNLQIFNVAENQFSGQIPVSVSNASHLSSLYLSKNYFVGKVPTMASLHNVAELKLFQNALGEGVADDLSFLYSLANNTKLEVLQMSDNNFGGAFPEIVSNFSTTLRHLSFGRNQISRRIPTEIGNLINLQVLGLEKNQLSGTIPPSIGNLQKLALLSMVSNKITGSIPSSMGNITSLIGVDLSGNKLEGKIPSSIGNCQKLLQMTLAGNKLIGSIPEEVISISSLSIYLDLSRNQLTGSLPIEVGKLVNLGALHIADNKLTGDIPSSLASCIRLEYLNLGGNSFQGNIPQSLSSLKAIQYLNFSHDNLTRQIPKFLEDFKLLTSLDLSFNELEGEVPRKGIFENATAISILENKDLCGGIQQLKLPKCSFHTRKQRSSTHLLLIIVISCGCLGIISMMCFVFLCYMRKEKKIPSPSFLEMSLLRVTYEDLRQATNEFSSSNLIGVGSFGSVYRGILSLDERMVVVKILNLLHRGALKSFMAECKALINIRHRNLIKVLTVCSSTDSQGNDFKALVYELMVNGNLDEWLHPVQTLKETHEPKNLNLVQRLNIAIDVVSALDYLHHCLATPIIHCDLKPSNVLLDGEMIACVGDFGLARFIKEVSDQLPLNQSSSIGLKGIIGYIAPEYGVGGEISTHGDVYSFGILLLEMFTAKRPTDDMFKDGQNLHNFVKMALPESVLDVMDPLLLKDEEQTSVASSRIKNRYKAQKYEDCVIAVLKVGVACSVELPTDRMDISAAEVELHRIRDSLLGTRMHGQREIVAL